MPGSLVSSFDNSGEVGGSRRNELLQFNNAVPDIAGLMLALSGDVLLAWRGVGPNSAATPIAIGSTDTQIGTAACVFTILGVPVAKTVTDAGTAIGAQTVPADTWAIYALDIVAAGTITVTAGAANATTGYATEALAIAALPTRVTVKARMGYITVKTKASTAWVAATDALAGGSSGNPASTTNYYPVTGICGPTGNSINGGANGVVIPTVLAIGSNDYEISWTAFTYNANGLSNINRAASTTGTAIGALGTCPADKCFGIALIIDGAGTVTYKAAGGSTAYGYLSEAAAAADAALITVSGKSVFGYVTGKTKASTAWICGTDAFQGGSTGNPASSTHYYPAAGVTLLSGQQSAQIANMIGTVISV